MSCVVSITCDQDMSSRSLLAFAIGPDGVGEAGRHIWHSEREGVVEVGSNGLAAPLVIHRVGGELVGPDSIKFVLCLVIVDQKLHVSVIVQVNHAHIVSRQDLGVVDGFTLDEWAIFLRHTVHADSFVEELGGENDDFTLVLRHLNDFDWNISDVAEYMLSPRLGWIKTFHRVLEPKKFTFASFGIGTRGDEIFAAIPIQVNPLAHMVEVVVFLSRELDSLYCLGEVLAIHANDIDATVFVSWH